MNEAIHDGGCPCGATRYRIESDPLFVHCCHCTECQQQTGSAFAVNAMIEGDRVTMLAGQVVENRIITGSSNPLIECRCTECRTVLWMHYASAGRRIAFVRAGTLNEPGRCPPDIHIYTRSKQDWIVLSDTAPAKRGYYDRAAYWPEDSIARHKAATVR